MLLADEQEPAILVSNQLKRLECRHHGNEDWD
jgi:hypothetical protein